MWPSIQRWKHHSPPDRFLEHIVCCLDWRHDTAGGSLFMSLLVAIGMRSFLQLTPLGGDNGTAHCGQGSGWCGSDDGQVPCLTTMALIKAVSQMHACPEITCGHMHIFLVATTYNNQAHTHISCCDEL